MTHLTHDQLGITAKHLAALIHTRGVLERTPTMSGRQVISEGLVEDEVPDEGLHKLFFNMGFQAEPTSCGTVACIGGHVSLHMQGVPIGSSIITVTRDEMSEAVDFVNSFGGGNGYSGIRSLYWPSSYVMGKATARDAVRAIDNFLTTGRPDWDEILPDPED